MKPSENKAKISRLPGWSHKQCLELLEFDILEEARTHKNELPAKSIQKFLGIVVDLCTVVTEKEARIDRKLFEEFKKKYCFNTTENDSLYVKVSEIQNAWGHFSRLTWNETEETF